MSVFSLCIVLAQFVECIYSLQPNILFILVDDLGFNDVGYMGNTNTQTPFIDELVTTKSLKLARNYVAKLCSPSRAALLTGRYPIRYGIQDDVLDANVPVSLSRQNSLLSNELQNQGYSTHMIGKWHLGFQSWEYTPTFRGFDNFFGYYTGQEDYYTHKAGCNDNVQRISLKDLRDGMDTTNEYDDIYGPKYMEKELLKLFQNVNPKNQNNSSILKPWFIYFALQAPHTPHQAPDEYYNLYESNDYRYSRKVHQAQTTSVDDIVKNIYEYLVNNDMWSNTLVIFSSDNGGRHNIGDNSPLRGSKYTSWEGGLRVPGFVTGGFLNKERYGKQLEIVNHVTDWYLTILKAAGLEFTNAKSTSTWDWDNNIRQFQTLYEDQYIDIDGIDIWDVIQNGFINSNNNVSDFDSREILLDMDSTSYCELDSCGAIMIGDWKFVRSNVHDVKAQVDRWDRKYSEDIDTLHCGDLNYNSINSLTCRGNAHGCLFNIQADPCEYNNLVAVYPDIANYLANRLNFYSDHQLLISAGYLTCVEVADGLDYWHPYQQYDEAIDAFETRLFTDWENKYQDIQSNVYDKHDVNTWKKILNNYRFNTKKDKLIKNKKSWMTIMLQGSVVIVLILLLICRYIYGEMRNKKQNNTKSIINNNNMYIDETTPLKYNDSRVDISQID